MISILRNHVSSWFHADLAACFDPACEYDSDECPRHLRAESSKVIISDSCCLVPQTLCAQCGYFEKGMWALVVGETECVTVTSAYEITQKYLDRAMERVGTGSCSLYWADCLHAQHWSHSSVASIMWQIAIRSALQPYVETSCSHRTLNFSRATCWRMGRCQTDFRGHLSTSCLDTG